ncbi:MAG TPA: hypothetical protein VFP18_01635, partial [Candidatus Binatia bacterium]|nr:hypothetical protein [Candidatus Binatia bacterium]
MLELQLHKCMEFKLSKARENLTIWVKRLADPGRKLRENQQRVDELSVDLLRRMQSGLRACKDRLNQEA